MRANIFVLVLVVAALARASSSEACSVFTAHDDTSAFAGNNEDYYGNLPTIIWFVPSDEGKYGYVAYGYEQDHFSQGGMNDQGLFWDGLAVPGLEVTGEVGTEPFTLTTLEEVMQVAATVDEAIAALREYDFASIMEYATFLFADKYGNAAIFEGDLVTEPAVDKHYLIATNFRPSNPELGNYPCWRYDLLTEMMEDGFELSFDDFAAMADAVHQGVVSYDGIYTRYTTVADLVNGVFYLYYDLDYSSPIVFDLDEELSQEAHEYNMYDLFYGDLDTDTDSDSDSDSDAGDDVPDGGADAGADDGDDGDCGCSAVGATDRPTATLLWLLAALAD